MNYDCIIIGGGIAGLQAAIQLGRYRHHILVIDSNNGRSNLCRAYHNILGWPDGVSGEQLRELGKKQALHLGIHFMEDKITEIRRQGEGFYLLSESGKELKTSHILIATGIIDRIPDFPEIYPCLGISVYVCPDCDGYEVLQQPTIVIGAGDVGANMALTLYYWTQSIVYVNHEQTKINPEILKKLNEKRIEVREQEIQQIYADGSQFKGVKLADGQKILAEKGFIALGGNQVKSELATQIGVEVMENNHIVVDSRTKMTNVPNVWAAGDVVAHSEQVTIAMGDGSQAAIWIHKSLLETIRKGQAN
ncbi:NAD(P)/FAD-dependent oxidoreductase [Bacillus carboniphilus]|uniref:NAD(P)/FAD-dependent oxidoreductase n=1 Tax=Bacillus carboniphilus TaxID=86663 RepID=A0ABN0W3J2_9BACI